MDGQLRLFDDPQIVVIGAELARLLEVDPDVAVDLLLLNFDVIGKSAREEEYHTLADFAERAVLADLAEAGGDGDVESRFFLDFADSGLLFGLAVLDVTFWEAPVPAVVVLDEQDLGVLTCLVEDDAAAGFFVQAADGFELDISQLGKAFAQLGLIEHLAVGGHDRTFAVESLKFGNSDDYAVKIFSRFLARHHIGAAARHSVGIEICRVQALADAAKQRYLDIVRNHCCPPFFSIRVLFDCFSAAARFRGRSSSDFY